MNRRILACLLAAGAPLIAADHVHAGVLAWGCQGQLDGQQIIFNREQLFVVDSNKPLGDVHKLIKKDIAPLITGPRVAFESNQDDGLFPRMQFSRDTPVKEKIVFTELSSKRTSGLRGYVCGREETTEIFSKVYRYQRGTTPERKIAMQCINYVLSTRLKTKDGFICFNIPPKPMKE